MIPVEANDYPSSCQTYTKINEGAFDGLNIFEILLVMIRLRVFTCVAKLPNVLANTI